MSDTPKDKPKAKPKANRRLAAAIERKRARDAAANDGEQEQLPTAAASPPQPPPSPPQPPPLDVRPIAPLWDLPDNDPPVRIPLDVLNCTVVYRYVMNDETGRHERVHCGTLPANATGTGIREKWGGGRFFLQARVQSRIVASREFMVDGPEQSKLPFGPVSELPSGLVTLQQDPAVAGYFAMFQMWMANQRMDFQSILGMQQETLKLLGSQFGASMVNTHLKEQLASALGRVSTLEKLLDEQREKDRENEKERIKAKYKGDKTDWVEVVEAVGEMAPAVLGALPPKLRAFLEGLALDSAKGGLPSGVTEHGLPG